LKSNALADLGYVMVDFRADLVAVNACLQH